MIDRPPPLPSRELVAMARLVLARSALHQVERQVPPDLDALLEAIDEAEARHEAERAASRAGHR